MATTLETITQEVLALPNSQRLALARIILDLDGGAPDPDVEAAWDREIVARMRAYDEGKLETVSWEAFSDEMRDRFRK